MKIEEVTRYRAEDGRDYDSVERAQDANVEHAKREAGREIGKLLTGAGNNSDLMVDNAANVVSILVTILHAEQSRHPGMHDQTIETISTGIFSDRIETLLQENHDKPAMLVLGLKAWLVELRGGEQGDTE